MAKRRFAILFTVLGVAFFISIVGFGLLYLAFGREPSVPSNATLVLRVGGNLSETAPDDVVGYLRGVRTPTVRGIVNSLRRAKVDKRIRAVLIKPTGFESPFWGKVQEVRDAMLDFKTSGKPLYAYLEYGGDREYYLATAADKIYLMPSTSLDLVGVATYQLFLRGTLDKIGAYPRPSSHRRLQDGGQHVYANRLHPRPQGNGRRAQSRLVRADRQRDRRRPEERRWRNSPADRRWAVPARGSAARRARRRRAV